MRVTERGTLSLDEAGLAREIRSGEAASIDPAVFTKLKRNLSKTNADLRASSEKSFSAQSSSKSKRSMAIRSGKLRAEDLLSTTSEPGQQIGSKIQEETVFSAQARCPGRTGVDYYWWGKRSFLDDCETEKLVAIFRRGATAAAVTAFVPGFGTAGAAIALIQGTTSAEIAATNQGRGVYINYIS